MKKVPMILLLVAPYGILCLCSLTNLDLTVGLYIYGAILLLNMVYAFLLPRFGFHGKQILFWNLVLKLCNIPLVLLILVVALVTMLIGGDRMDDILPSMILIVFLCCYVLQLSSGVFGLSGFLWFRKHGTLSNGAVIVATVGQLIPCVDILGAILCYSMFPKAAHEKEGA